jgi:hypothetical protein
VSPGIPSPASVSYAAQWPGTRPRHSERPVGQDAIFDGAKFSRIATDAHEVIQSFNVGAEPE